MRKRPNLAREIAKGVVAGAVATYVMGRVTSYLYQHEDPKARRREDRARGGKTAYGVAAEKVAALFGQDISDEERRRLGALVHWSLGIGTAALYAALRHQVEKLEWGHGVAFGTAFWGLVDEGMTPALGLTPGPQEFPWQTHGRGLAGHITYGVVANSTLRLLDRVV